MIEVQTAQIYSTQGAIAYQITYTDGTEVRALEQKNNIIAKQYKKNGSWVQAGAAYKVDHSKKRAAEKIKDHAIKFIK